MGDPADAGGAVAEVRRRLERVEVDLAALRETPPAAPAPTPPGRPAEFEPAVAEALLRDVLPALRAVARAKDDRLRLVAHADARTGGSGSPQSVRVLVAADLAGALARLGAAVGSGRRARILQALALGEERTMAELGAASGAAGGNFCQHLHGANLLYQPGRCRYGLAANGRHTMELLLQVALEARTSPPPELAQR